MPSKIRSLRRWQSLGYQRESSCASSRPSFDRDNSTAPLGTALPPTPRRRTTVVGLALGTHIFGTLWLSSQWQAPNFGRALARAHFTIRDNRELIPHCHRGRRARNGCVIPLLPFIFFGIVSKNMLREA